MRPLLIALILLVVVVPATRSAADVPELMSYQGLLRDGVGDPVPDGAYSLTFRIYDAAVGGTVLWTETQDVTVTESVFSATLGEIVPLTVDDFGDPHFLSVSVGGDPELLPRVELTTAPYAFRAAVAESLAGGGTDSDWQYSGDDIHRLTGHVSIGTDSPFGRLTVTGEGDEHAATISGNGTGPWFTMNVWNPSGTAGAFSTSGAPGSYPTTPAAVYAGSGSTADAGHFIAHGDGKGVLAYSIGDGNVIDAHALGGGYAGYFEGGLGVLMDCPVTMEAFRMTAGASSGHVLTSDEFGIGSWEAPAAVPDADWTIDSDDMYSAVSGYVGIGETTPESKLHVRNDWGGQTSITIENQSTGFGSSQVLRFEDEEGTAFIGVYDEGNPSYPDAMVIGNTRTAEGNIRFHAGTAEWMRITGNGFVGIGVTEPSTKLDVQGPVKMIGFQMPTGASDGYVLTSNGVGDGTWEAPTAAADGDWTIAGSDMYSAVAGDVGIGTSAPTAKLEVSSGASDEVLQVTQTGTYSRGVNIERTTAPVAGNDILQIEVPSGSVDGFQFIECQRDGIEFQVNGDGYIYSGAGAGLGGALTVTHTGSQAGTFTTNYASGDAHVIHAEYTGSDASTHSAVYGECRPAGEWGMGGLFYGGYAGVRAVADVVGTGYRYGVSADALYGDYNCGVKALGTGGGSNYGLYGETLGTGTGRAVRGYAHGTGTNYAISAYAHGGATNWAGYFTGNVHVNGTFSKTAGSFRIDHPLDPEGQYLQHSFVESPDMMNVYNGNTILDGNGEAWVELPEWFEVLNRDFRYQLTCIGGFAPVYVAEKIRGNRFQIAGGQPGLEVSWQVTGVRQDPYAEAHRIEVEVPKAADEVGRYVSPEVYGRPIEDGIGYDAPPPSFKEPAATGAVAPLEQPTTDDE